MGQCVSHRPRRLDRRLWRLDCGRVPVRLAREHFGQCGEDIYGDCARVLWCPFHQHPTPPRILSPFAECERSRFYAPTHALTCSQIPGPVAARFTKFYGVIAGVLPSYQYFMKTEEWHKEYNTDVIRTGPREVNVYSADAIPLIHGPMSRCTKGPWYSGSVSTIPMQSPLVPYTDYYRDHLVPHWWRIDSDYA